MSISDIKPGDCPSDLRAKIDKVAARMKVTWEEAVVFLALKVVSPEAAKTPA